MATAYLNNGATSLAAVNWSDATGFAGTAELVIMGGSQNITSDVDQGGSGNIRFLRIARDFSGNIGTASAPLDCDATDGTAAEWSTAAPNEGRIVHSGTGSLFVQSDADGISNFMQDGPGKSFIISGTVPYVRVNAGTFQAETAATIGSSGKVTLNGGSATLLAKTSGPTTIDIQGGSHILNRPATTINAYSGRVIIDCADAASSNVTINIHGDAYVEIVRLTTAGTVNVNRYGGMFETARMQKDLTIATMYTSSRAKFGSLPKGGGALTITNQYKLDADAQTI